MAAVLSWLANECNVAVLPHRHDYRPRSSRRAASRNSAPCDVRVTAQETTRDADMPGQGTCTAAFATIPALVAGGRGAEGSI